jgi:DNA-binding IclR family transcriptional regulator
MRIFEFHEDELIPYVGEYCTSATHVQIVDLDSIVMLAETRSPESSWSVHLSSGDSFSVTEAAFGRVLLAWKSD